MDDPGGQAFSYERRTPVHETRFVVRLRSGEAQDQVVRRACFMRFLINVKEKAGVSPAHLLIEKEGERFQNYPFVCAGTEVPRSSP